MPPTVHIIGAGLSGLAAAVALAAEGLAITVYEAAGHAGGRCRSYFDPIVGREIDNGNHLVLSGNRAISAYLATIGAGDRMTGPARADYPFIDITTGERWRVRPSAGPIPWWIFRPGRRVPGSRAGNYLGGLKLAFAGAEATVIECLGNGPVFRRFWEPLAVGVLNTPAESGAACLLWPVLRETFGRGEHACRPRMARRNLADCFVEPALAYLGKAGASVRLGTRIKALTGDGSRIDRLVFAAAESVAVAAGDVVILAVPAWVAAALLPGLSAPRTHTAIINGHFRLAAPPPGPLLLGMVGGLCQWLFVRDDVASVTISAADHLLDRPADDLAAAMWREVAIALDCRQAPLPPARVVREKRATFRQTPEEVARRPGCKTSWRNLYLAGDWTATGLPATLEGSVRSGNTAAAKAKAYFACG